MITDVFELVNNLGFVMHDDEPFKIITTAMECDKVLIKHVKDSYYCVVSKSSLIDDGYFFDTEKELLAYMKNCGL